MITFLHILQDGEGDGGLQIGEEGNRSEKTTKEEKRTIERWVGWVGEQGNRR